MDNSSKSDKEHIELDGRVFPIESEEDLVNIREFGRRLAEEIGFDGNNRTLIATALSEVCRNVLEYAGSGEVSIDSVNNDSHTGIIVVVSDSGPGIQDVDKAMQEGYSTGKGMGIGLPGARRIMDEFDLESDIGGGTTVTMRKWLDHYEF